MNDFGINDIFCGKPLDDRRRMQELIQQGCSVAQEQDKGKAGAVVLKRDRQSMSPVKNPSIV